MNFFQINLDTIAWVKTAELMIQNIEQDPKSRPFRYPVDEVKDQAIDYYKIISHPMDLTTLRHKLEMNDIINKQDFVYQFLMIWKNAQKYNCSSSHPVHIAAKTFEVLSMKMIQYAWKQDYRSGTLFKSFRSSERIKKSMTSSTKHRKQSELVSFLTRYPKTHLEEKSESMDNINNINTNNNDLISDEADHNSHPIQINGGDLPPMVIMDEPHKIVGNVNSSCKSQMKLKNENDILRKELDMKNKLLHQTQKKLDETCSRLTFMLNDVKRYRWNYRMKNIL